MGFIHFILFMCGQLGIMVLARFFFQWLIDFISQPVSQLNGDTDALLSASLVGIALLGFRIFDGVTDPIAGSLSDLWVKKGKERRVLLWYTAPLPAIGMTLCFVPSAEQSIEIRWVLLLLGMLLFFIGYTLYALPYWSLIGDYTQGDEERRGKLSTLLGVGLLIATTIGFIITPKLIESFGYLHSAMIISILSIPLMIAPYFAAPPLNISSQSKHKFIDDLEGYPRSQFNTLIAALKHRKFMAIICLFAGSQMSFTVMTAAAPFIATDLLGGNKSDVALILGPLLAVALPTSVIIPKVNRKFGWEKGVATACLGLGCVYLGAGGLGITVFHSPLVTAALLFALGGPMVALLLGLEGEAITACAKESNSGVGIYFGVYNLVVKGANGIAIAITSILAEQARSGDPWKVKLMGMSAGIMLLIGLISYIALKPQTSRPPNSHHA